ncbi:MAG: hypothetical protein U9Q06_03900 [Nanoarchaeota archaeon]|nr:hypothetical protein [Nanoarchaeota archaeon]
MLLNKQSNQHWPTLNTVIMIEDTMKKLDSLFTIAELKRNLPRQVNHNTLMLILYYLEESNKILVSLKGITWIHNSNIKLKNAIKKGTEI